MPDYEVVIEEGPPSGGLYELEQTTYYRIVDRRTQAVVMTFRSELEASLSTEDGSWNDYRCAGVSNVAITSDGLSVRAEYYDGHVEITALTG